MLFAKTRTRGKEKKTRGKDSWTQMIRFRDFEARKKKIWVRFFHALGIQFHDNFSSLWDGSGGGQNKRNLRRFIHAFGETHSRVFLESPIRDASKYLKFRLNKRRLVWSAWSKAATTKIAKQFHLQWQFPTIALLQVGLCSKRALSERFVAGLDLAHGNRFSRTVKRSFSKISQCKVSCECASRLCNKFHCSGFRYRFNFLGRFTADCSTILIKISQLFNFVVVSGCFNVSFYVRKSFTVNQF